MDKFSNIQLNFFMDMALQEAQKALEADEIPVGSVMVANGRVIAKGHNMTEKLTDATAHAEMIAMTAAEENLGSKYLNECTLFVTLEPCAMCAAAMQWTKVGQLVYGADDNKQGFTTISTKLLHQKTKVIRGIREAESTELLKSFFQSKR